jgi:polygalacturonase
MKILDALALIARREWLICSLLLICVTETALSAPLVVDVRDAGAVGDGRALCTAAIQQSIERCAAAGGGTVFFPAGTYSSGTLELRSRVTLHLDSGATLLGSARAQDYPPRRSIVQSYSDNYVRQALLVGENLDQVIVRGSGTIDGNGGRLSIEGIPHAALRDSFRPVSRRVGGRDYTQGVADVDAALAGV